MVCDDQIATRAFGLVEHLLGYVHRQQGGMHLVLLAADHKSRIVIGLLPAKRGAKVSIISVISLILMI